MGTNNIVNNRPMSIIETSASSLNAVVNTIYISEAATGTFTLPAECVIGDTMTFLSYSPSAIIVLAVGTSQSIDVGAFATTTTTGTLTVIGSVTVVAVDGSTLRYVVTSILGNAALT